MNKQTNKQTNEGRRKEKGRKEGKTERKRKGRKVAIYNKCIANIILNRGKLKSEVDKIVYFPHCHPI